MADKQLKLSPSRMTKMVVIRVCYVSRDHGFYRSNKETTVVFKKLQQFSWLFRWTLKIPLFPNLCGFFLVKIPPLPPLFKLLRWLIGKEAVAVLSKVWLNTHQTQETRSSWALPCLPRAVVLKVFLGSTKSARSYILYHMFTNTNAQQHALRIGFQPS